MNALPTDKGRGSNGSTGRGAGFDPRAGFRVLPPSGIHLGQITLEAGLELVAVDGHQSFGEQTTRVRQLNAQVIDYYEREFKNVYYKRESCCG